MALSRCSECGLQISRSAKACPRCGHPPFRVGKPIAIVVFVAIFTLLIIMGRPNQQHFDPTVYPEVRTKSGTNDAFALYTAVLDKTRRCTLTGGLRALAVKGGDRVTIYQAAKNEDEACVSVDRELSRLSIPKSLDRTAASAFDYALEGCKAAALAQWSSANALHEALEGGKLKDLARFRSAEKSRMASDDDCMGKVEAAAMLAGVSSGAFSGEPVDDGYQPCAGDCAAGNSP